MSKRKKTQEEYVAELNLIHPNIEVIDTYLGGKYRIKHRCKECGYGSNGEWQPTPANLLSGHNCPICSPTNKKIGPAPEFRNSIWASSYKALFKNYMTEDQMKSYTPFSASKISMHCPDCGATKMIAPQTISGMGCFGCKCSDGQSYPNKFVYALLDQLAVNYISEYSPNWAENKRYDIYIPSIDCIIENHGMQHYEEQLGIFGDYTDIKDNDEYKKQLAKRNGIKHYISLDCRYSTIDWISKSILQSLLPEILNFTESSINWCDCAEYATKNIVRAVADLWNNDLAVKEICEQTANSKSTVIRYLNKANKLGWCEYSGNEANKRNIALDIFKARSAGRRRKVYCVELNKYFDSLTAAAQFLNCTPGHVQACCSGRYSHVKGYHFQYIDSAPEQLNK